MPSDTQTAIDLVLHDFRRLGVLPDLTLEVRRPPLDPPRFANWKGPVPRSTLQLPPGFSHDDEVIVLCSEEARVWRGAHIRDLLEHHPLVLRLAEAAYEAVIERRWGDPFPTCPAHHTHPLSPQLRDGDVYWECPTGGIDPIPLGFLPDDLC